MKKKKFFKDSPKIFNFILSIIFFTNENLSESFNFHSKVLLWYYRKQNVCWQIFLLWRTKRKPTIEKKNKILLFFYLRFFYYGYFFLFGVSAIKSPILYPFSFKSSNLLDLPSPIQSLVGGSKLGWGEKRNVCWDFLYLFFYINHG